METPRLDEDQTLHVAGASQENLDLRQYQKEGCGGAFQMATL